MAKTKPVDEVARIRGNRIRVAREALKLTQDQVAGRGGIERVEVVAVESGRNQLSTSRMQSAIAAGLGVSRDSLLAYLNGFIEVDQIVERHVELPVPPVPTQPLDTLMYNARKRAIELLVKREVDLDTATSAVDSAVAFEQRHGGVGTVQSEQLAKMAAALILHGGHLSAATHAQLSSFGLDEPPGPRKH